MVEPGVLFFLTVVGAAMHQFQPVAVDKGVDTTFLSVLVQWNTKKDFYDLFYYKVALLNKIWLFLV